MVRAGRHTIARRVLALVVGSTIAATACAGDEPAGLPAQLDVPETVALGAFPEPLTGDTVVAAPPTTVGAPTTTTTVAELEPITGPIGDEVFGNRILVIGDTVIASTAPRFDGVMCDVLGAFGWNAEIAAEVGRFVDFGRTVVEARVGADAPDWDAFAIMLGNHFDGDVPRFRVELDALIEALSPLPILLYTLAEDDTFQAALNDVIRDMPRFHPNVVILDWGEISAADAEVILADSPSGLSDEGRDRLALFTAAALGEAPTTDDAGCAPPVFVDDTAIVL